MLQLLMSFCCIISNNLITAISSENSDIKSKGVWICTYVDLQVVSINKHKYKYKDITMNKDEI